MDDDMLRFIMWELERINDRRSAIVSRAKFMLSSSALLIAANTFLIEQIIKQLSKHNYLIASLVVISIVTATGSLGISSLSILNVFSRAKDRYNIGDYKRLMHPGNIVRENNSSEDFKEIFESLSLEDIKERGITEIWVQKNQHKERYDRLRVSAQLVLASTFSFVLSLLFLIIYLYKW